MAMKAVGKLFALFEVVGLVEFYPLTVGDIKIFRSLGCGVFNAAPVETGEVGLFV